MPGERCGIHRASVVMTLAVSLMVTAVLVLAAADASRQGERACARRATPATRAC